VNTSMATLADTHCHLTEDIFEKDCKQVIERALEGGIEWIVVPGMDIESSKRAIALAEEYPNVFAAVGVHPHNADGWDGDSFPALNHLAQADNVVAIGEIGLDHYRNFSSQDNQLHAFRAQLELAAKLSLPIIVHNRQATGVLIPELDHWVSMIADKMRTRPGVLHAFSEELSVATHVINAGFYIGIAGPISYKNSSKLQEIVTGVPLTKMLTETDSPFLTPAPKRNERNEPVNVTVVAEHLSRIIERDYDSTVRITSQNAAKLFGWQNGNH
jgi:TatD DNase family protein